MGIRIQVGNYTLQASDYSVEEAATPLAAGDSSGGVGSISFTVPQPDLDATRGTPSSTYTDWTTQRTNTAINPRLVSGGDILGFQPRWSWSATMGYAVSDHPLGITTARRFRATADVDAGATRGVDRGGNSDTTPASSTGSALAVPVTPGVDITFGAWFKANLSQHPTFGVQVRTRFHDGTGNWMSANAFPASYPGMVSGQWYWLQFTVTPPAGGTYLAYRYSFSSSINQRIDDDILITGVLDGPTGDFFDGDSPDFLPLDRNEWLGTPNASPSVHQTRTSVGVSGYTFMDTAWRAINEFGPDILLDLPVTLTDSRKGFTLGTVQGANRADDQGTIQITCSSRLSDINVYGIQAAPFVGTLENAFDYYLGLAGITTGVFVDETIASRAVVFPGWTGELWYHLKQMAVSQDCDLSLVSGIVLLRPIRARVATRGRDIGRSRDLSSQTLAQSVEVYQYNNQSISNQLVYPPGGWTPEVEVMNVNAGETSEYVLDLSASVSSIQDPIMQTFVSEDFSSWSTYTVVANDGLPLSPSLWADYGGSLTVAIEPDTRHLRVTLRGAVGLPTTEGGPATQFSVALASDATGNRYSTFRIAGTGVAFNRVKKRIRTGVSAARTATEVGVTIDNPFISTVDDLYRAGTRAAKQYAGQTPTLSGVVTAINRLGDTGQATYPTYDETQAELYAELGAPTYAAVQTYYTTTLPLTTYESVKTYWFDFVRDDFTNQVFGNVNGARIYDRNSRRWYRIRQGTATADRVTFSAEDDLTHGDIEDYYVSKTYGDVELILSGLTYKQADLVGLYGN